VQYVLHAYDFTDPEALERRMAIRPTHLDGVRAMKARGEFHLGGALLDERGRMIGSMMLVEFPTEAALQAWLEVEPYVTDRVWERIDVKPFRRAEV
jgi:uncharacterized protein YciI